MYWNYVIIGYGVVLGGLAIYSGWVVRRGRKLSRQVDPGRRRFLD
jgi:hypothetical protein